MRPDAADGGAAAEHDLRALVQAGDDLGPRAVRGAGLHVPGDQLAAVDDGHRARAVGGLDGRDGSVSTFFSESTEISASAFMPQRSFPSLLGTSMVVGEHRDVALTWACRSIWVTFPWMREVGVPGGRHRGRLADLELRHVVLVHLGLQPHGIGIDDGHERRAGADEVADVDGDLRHHARDGGADGGRIVDELRLLQGALRLGHGGLLRLDVRVGVLRLHVLVGELRRGVRGLRGLSAARRRSGPCGREALVEEALRVVVGVLGVSRVFFAAERLASAAARSRPAGLALRLASFAFCAS